MPFQKQTSMKLNKRQKKCIAALATSHGFLEQMNPQTAAWHIHGGSSTSQFRLSLTGGDVWKLVKMGLISKCENKRRFSLNRVEVEAPVCSNIKLIEQIDSHMFQKKELSLAA